MKLNITPGEWTVERYCDENKNIIQIIIKGGRYGVCKMMGDFEDEAELIAEAGNVYNETGMSPEEMWDRIQKLSTERATEVNKLKAENERLRKALRSCYNGMTAEEYPESTFSQVEEALNQ